MRLRANVLQMMLLASVLRVPSSVPYHFCRSPMSFVGKSTFHDKNRARKTKKDFFVLQLNEYTGYKQVTFR